MPRPDVQRAGRGPLVHPRHLPGARVPCPRHHNHRYFLSDRRFQRGRELQQQLASKKHHCPGRHGGGAWGRWEAALPASRRLGRPPAAGHPLLSQVHGAQAHCIPYKPYVLLNYVTYTRWLSVLCPAGFPSYGEVLCIYQRWASGTFFGVRNRNSATIKGMLLRNRNSAIAIFLKSATWELHFRNFRYIFGRIVSWNYIFLPPDVFCYSENFKGSVARDFRPLFFREKFPYENLVYESGIRCIHEKKSGQKSRATVPLRQVFGFQRNRKFYKYFWYFLKPAWAEEKVLESSGTGRKLLKVAELRKSNFEGPQSQFSNFF